MKQYLSAFIHALEDRGLLKFDILGNGERSFDNRFMIQKYVYLARYFNLEMGYGFSMYLHGPYSRSLADDYYDLAIDEAMEAEFGPGSVSRTSDLNGLQVNTFFEFVNGRDREWLEAATTLLSLSRHFTDRRRLLERTTNMKDHIPEGRIESILRTLEKNGLVSPPSL
jgi:uncharacterized protein YwgA